MKYTITTFTWDGGPLKNIPVSTFGDPNTDSVMHLVSVEPRVIDNRYGEIQVAISLKGGAGKAWPREAYEFVDQAFNDLMVKPYAQSKVNDTCQFLFRVLPVNGEPLTDLVMGPA